MIKWEPRYTVGDTTLDSQHQRLLSLINEIMDQLKTPERADQEFIKKTLKELFDYTQYHFKDEERRFSNTAYPFINEHIRAHRDFTKKVQDLLAEQNNGYAPLRAIQIAQVALNWIHQHVIKFDQGYAQYIKKTL